MRMATILKWALIGGILSAAGGCRKNFMSINTDPDVIGSSQINFNYLFTNAELQTSGNTDGNGYEDWRNNLIYSSCMIQHLSSTEFYWDGDKYLYSAPYNSAYWDENYPNAIANMAEVMQHTMNDGSQANFYQICRIFRVFMFQRMTDMYGDCPYFQAGLGYISGITAPVYDKQQDIYTDMLEELEDAANRLNPQAANTVGKADLLYGGDVGAWQRFAYSEMTRLAMRLVKVDPDIARQWVTIAAGGGVFRGNIDNAVVPHQDITGTPVVSGTGLILIGNDPNGYRLSQTFVSFLRNSGDPRLPYLATVCSNPDSAADMGDTTAADQLGQPNGFDGPNSGTPFDLTLASGWPGNQNSYSVVNRYTFARLDAPTFFLTYSETQLLLAEAAARGWIGGDPAAYYTAGVQGAMQQLAAQAGAGPRDTAILTWLQAHPYNPNIGLQQINEQYWVAGFMDENECFANWRRSGYPVLTPVSYPGNVTGGTIPRRFTYPQTEASTNTANYNAAVSRLANGDRMTSRVWWDQ
jgi:Starch-binding associating with outer membrane